MPVKIMKEKAILSSPIFDILSWCGDVLVLIISHSCPSTHCSNRSSCKCVCHATAVVVTTE
jgi:hypothetical protein